MCSYFVSQTRATHVIKPLTSIEVSALTSQRNRQNTKMSNWNTTPWLATRPACKQTWPRLEIWGWLPRALPRPFLRAAHFVRIRQHANLWHDQMSKCQTQHYFKTIEESEAHNLEIRISQQGLTFRILNEHKSNQHKCCFSTVLRK